MSLNNLAFILAFFIGKSLGCGISTHTEILQRAAQTYDNPAFGPGVVKRIIAQHQDAFQAGAPFPDAFYNTACKEGSLHYVSEDTHWGPYQKVAWDYFRRTYPDPIGNEKAEKLMAFLLGMASHQVADVLWHALEGLDDGLIEMLAQTTFDGDFGAGHDFADFGGDILGVVNWDTSFANQWFVPTEDLLNIFIDYYGSDLGITHNLINICSEMLLAGRLAEQELGAVLYGTYASKSAIFLDEYQDYFMGGVDDMSVWTRLVWDLSLTLAANGTENCYIPKNPMNIDCSGTSLDNLNHKNEEKKLRKMKIFKNIENAYGEDLITLSSKFIKSNPSPAGVTFQSTKAPKPELLRSASLENKAYTPQTVLFTKDANSKLGASLKAVDVNNDGLEDIVVGAPGFGKGCIYIMYGSSQKTFPEGDIDIDEYSDVKLCSNYSEDPFSRFGHDVLVQDFNGDNLNDIIVGSPSSGLKDSLYDGAVYIYLGSHDDSNGLVFNEDNILVIRPPKDSNQRTSTFGWSLAPLESGSFLVSTRHRTQNGQTQSGGVFLVESNQENVKEFIFGESPFIWTGSVVHKLENQQVAAVGSPLWATEVKGSGKLDLIDIQTGSVINSVAGSGEFSQLGYSVTQTTVTVDFVEKDVILVGAPTFTYDAGLVDNHKHSGAVMALDLDILLGGGSASDALVLKIESDKSHGRFGRTLHSSKDKFWIGAPRYSGALPTQEHGAVFSYPRFSSLPQGDISEDCGLGQKPCPGRHAIDVIIAPGNDPQSQFGDKIASLSVGQTSYLLVSAPVSSRHARQSGVVYIYKNI